MKFNPNLNGPIQPKHRGGFTLVEMLLVLAILTILAGLIYPRLAQQGPRARIAAAKVQIKSFDDALQTFEIDNGHFPKSHDGLRDLVQAPSDSPNWHGPYLAEIPKDPWGNAYAYVYPSIHHGTSYDVSSAGPDGQTGNGDDINNWPAPEASR